MRCYICDCELSEQEVQHNVELDDKIEPCHTCLDIIYDTAFSDGFKPDGEDTGIELIEKGDDDA